jgi:hypothetical protein
MPVQSFEVKILESTLDVKGVHQRLDIVLSNFRMRVISLNPNNFALFSRADLGAVG